LGWFRLAKIAIHKLKSSRPVESLVSMFETGKPIQPSENKRIAPANTFQVNFQAGAERMYHFCSWKILSQCESL
jgi:hypothetical protein